MATQLRSMYEIESRNGLKSVFSGGKCANLVKTLGYALLGG
jgi:hypothetical protein